MQLNNEILKNIIDKHLFDVPLEIKKQFPATISRPTVYRVIVNEKAYFLLSFCGGVEKERIEKITAKNFHPYPGLIAGTSTNDPVAFKLENARYNYFQNCNVSNMLGFSTGSDSTIILSDYRQSIYTPELGRYKFKIDLAYIISYGKEIKSREVVPKIRTVC